jgi:hypothetical protein
VRRILMRVETDYHRLVTQSYLARSPSTAADVGGIASLRVKDIETDRCGCDHNTEEVTRDSRSDTDGGCAYWVPISAPHVERGLVVGVGVFRRLPPRYSWDSSLRHDDCDPSPGVLRNAVYA